MATYKIGSVQLVKAPESTKELLALRKKLGLEVSISQFKEMVQNLPCNAGIAGLSVVFAKSKG